MKVPAEFLDNAVELIRKEARAAGWVGTLGMKDYAKQTYGANLSLNRWGEWQKVSIKDEKKYLMFIMKISNG